MNGQLNLFDTTQHSAKLAMIAPDACIPHELNPRMTPSEEVIQRIAEQIQKDGFGPEHAILVRPMENGKYQIVSGHHRVEAAKRAGITTIPAWVAADMTDAKAHSLLLLENDQSELTPLEKGKHAYEHLQLEAKAQGGRGKKGGIREYTRAHNYSNEAMVRQWLSAYEVLLKTAKNLRSLSVWVLYEISKAPETAWQALCNEALNQSWTVEQTKKTVSKINQIDFTNIDGYDALALYSKAVQKGSIAEQYARVFDDIRAWTDKFMPSITLYKWNKTGETKTQGFQILEKLVATPYQYKPRKAFITLVHANKPLERHIIDTYAQSILNKIAAEQEGGEKWVPQRSPEDLRKLEELAAEQRLAEAIRWRGVVEPNSVYVADSTTSDIHQAIDPETVDMIFTDPPWGSGQLVAYSNVAQLAAHCLKPGAYCAIYMGKMYIPEIIAYLTSTLEYVWLFSVFHPFSKSKIVQYNIFENWRPVGLFRKPGGSRPKEWIQDVVRAQRNKDHHEWQQDEETARLLIGAYTQVGELVFDPYAGSGTTLVAAKSLGRRWLGLDKDEDAVRTTLERLNSVKTDFS